jgi:hypothetical protein
MRVVVSQSMYFPWVGFLEQLRLADIFVRYDDVQFSKGSFTNRVQIKTSVGPRWLTVPLREMHLGQRIDEVQLKESTDWRSQHREMLRQAYLRAPFREEMLGLVDRVFAQPAMTISDVSHASVMALADYYGLTSNLRILGSSTLGINDSSSQRVLDIVLSLKGNVYITGHGARNYLNHERFESSGIAVQYMRYTCTPYPQLHGDFTPYVSGLDLVANCGSEGIRFIQSAAVEWREFLNESARTI